MPHLGTEGSFLIGGVLGLMLLMWLMQPHPTLDRINTLDITEDKLQRATHSKDAGSCLYVIGLLIVIFIVTAFVIPAIFKVWTPEDSAAVYRNFWHVGR